MIARGKSVSLKKTESIDLEALLRLWNDGRVMKWVGFPEGLGYDLERMRIWHERLFANADRLHCMVLSDARYCGEVFYEKNPGRGRAGLDIKMFPEFQGKGLAGEALSLMIDHCFRIEAEIDEVWTEPSAENAGALRLYERCGLKPKPRPEDMEEAGAYWALERDRWAAARRG